jgi:hypothetical protein
MTVSFLTSELDGDELSASRSSRFIPKESVSCAHWIGAAEPHSRSGGFVEERSTRSLPETEPRSLSHPARRSVTILTESSPK